MTEALTAFRIPEHLGDGLYAEFDGWQIRLWAPREAGVVHEVFLEPEVLNNFSQYVVRLSAAINAFDREWTSVPSPNPD